MPSTHRLAERPLRRLPDNRYTLQSLCMYKPLLRCARALCDAHSPQESVMVGILQEQASLHLFSDALYPAFGWTPSPSPTCQSIYTAKRIPVSIPQTAPCSISRLPIRSNQGGVISRIAPSKAFTLSHFSVRERVPNELAITSNKVTLARCNNRLSILFHLKL